MFTWKLADTLVVVMVMCVHKERVEFGLGGGIG